jgi:hypothetical protein
MAKYVCVDGWAGRREFPVCILSRTTKTAWVLLLEDAALPKGLRYKGEVVRVPLWSIKEREESNA